MRRTGPTGPRLVGLPWLAGLGALASMCAAVALIGHPVVAHASPAGALRAKHQASHSKGPKRLSRVPTALPTLTAPSHPTSLSTAPPTPTLTLPSLPILPTLSLLPTAAPSTAPATSAAGLPAGAPSSAPRLSSEALGPAGPVAPDIAASTTVSPHAGAAAPATASAVPPPAGPSPAPQPSVESGLIDHLVPVDVSAPVKFVALILLTLVLLSVLLTGMALRTGRRTHLGFAGRHDGDDRDEPVEAMTPRLDSAERPSARRSTRDR